VAESPTARHAIILVIARDAISPVAFAGAQGDIVAAMSGPHPDSRPIRPGTVLPPRQQTVVIPAALGTALTPAGQAALAAAQAVARNAAAPATLRAYKADWTHFSQ
jgi:hypothetical protein